MSRKYVQEEMEGVKLDFEEAISEITETGGYRGAVVQREFQEALITEAILDNERRRAATEDQTIDEQSQLSAAESN